MLNKFGFSLIFDSVFTIILIFFFSLKLSLADTPISMPNIDVGNTDENASEDWSAPTKEDVDQGIIEQCNNSHGLRKPRIEISSITPSGSGRYHEGYRIEGAVYGACLSNAGFYESGRLVEKFNTEVTIRPKKIDFTATAVLDKRGEIRVSTIDGSEDRVYLDDEIMKYRRSHSEMRSLDEDPLRYRDENR